jgi:glycopeptide antibiotics resistance protein
MLLEFFPYPFLAGLILLSACLAGPIHRRAGFWSLLCSGLFGVYLLTLIGVTLFPIPVLDDPAARLTWQRVAFTLSHVNLVPFYYGTNVLPGFLVPEMLQNILLTVPFGFGVSFVARLKARDMLWLGPAVGLAIELAQLLISFWVGGPYRSTDINDILLNAAGVWIGYGLFSLIARLILRFVHGDKTGLVAFLQEIAGRIGS